MERIEVLKTYKIFIGGQFPRTESGRYYPLKLKNNITIKSIPKPLNLNISEEFNLHSSN